VIGSSCAGKTTLAGRLAESLGVRHIELDTLHHGRNWEEASAAVLRERVEKALAGLDGWVADGNYMSKLGMWLIDQADTIVWLDLPLRTSLARMWRRTSTRIRTGEELWAGNRESWRNFLVGRDSLLWFTVRNHHRRHRVWPPRLAGRNVVRLRSQAAADAWLARQARG
jgi:adenylate kinase family enzyme